MDEYIVYGVTNINLNTGREFSDDKLVRYYFGRSITGGLHCQQINNNNPNHPEVKILNVELSGDYEWALKVHDVAARSECKRINVVISKKYKFWISPDFTFNLMNLSHI